MRRAYAVKFYIEIDDDDFVGGSVVTDDIVQITNDCLRFAEEDHAGYIDTRLAEVKPVPISSGPEGEPVPPPKAVYDRGKKARAKR